MQSTSCGTFFSRETTPADRCLPDRRLTQRMNGVELPVVRTCVLAPSSQSGPRQRVREAERSVLHAWRDSGPHPGPLDRTPAPMCRPLPALWGTGSSMRSRRSDTSAKRPGRDAGPLYTVLAPKGGGIRVVTSAGERSRLSFARDRSAWRSSISVLRSSARPWDSRRAVPTARDTPRAKVRIPHEDDA